MAVNNKGAELWLGTAANAMTKVANLTSVTPPSKSRTTLDATVHDSPEDADEVITDGIVTSSEISATIDYEAGSDGDTKLDEAVTTGALQFFRVVTKTTAGKRQRSGKGYVLTYSVDAQPVRGKQTATVTIKPTGPITSGAVPAQSA